ncbi:uncharacterized protein LOC142163849 [Nicotiana tabacum]|uniref:Uncharacterized protein LOC142163849 n=1 Tax=Nicotiana tabacum TaxID=4097 RepID=A0AC58RWP1_TOBAC
MRQKYYNPQIKTFMPMEKHASKVLMPFAFKLLQDEMILSIEYVLFPHSDGSYLVRHYIKIDGGRFVYWNSIEEVVQCSFQDFEFSGILCRHSIRSLHATFRDLTLESIKTKGRLEYAKKELQRVLQIVQCFPENDHTGEVHEHVSFSRSIESNSLDEDYHIENPQQSQTKGRKKGKRLVGGIEVAKKLRYCKVPNCGGIGHNSRNCPVKRKITEIPATQSPNKILKGLTKKL